jgi:hypothetical protein
MSHETAVLSKVLDAIKRETFFSEGIIISVHYNSLHYTVLKHKVHIITVMTYNIELCLYES